MLSPQGVVGRHPLVSVGLAQGPGVGGRGPRALGPPSALVGRVHPPRPTLIAAGRRAQKVRTRFGVAVRQRRSAARAHAHGTAALRVAATVSVP